LKRALGLRPVIGAVIAGGLLWLPSHDAGTAATTSAIFFVILAGLQVIDPWLAPLWALLATVIPGWLRKVIGIGLPILLAINRFGPAAAGKEVATARSTLIIATLVAYVFLRPRKADAGSAARPAVSPAPAPPPPPPPPPPPAYGGSRG
jgi:hypothetical protein